MSRIETEQRPELALPRWWQEHSELDDMVEDLTRMLASGSLDGILAAFSVFEDALDAHFYTEESIYFPLIERLCPDEAGAVRAARRGHDRMRSALNDLQDLLGDGDRRSARRVLVQLLDGFREHEAHEEQLIQRLKSASAYVSAC